MDKAIIIVNHGSTNVEVQKSTMDNLIKIVKCSFPGLYITTAIGSKNIKTRLEGKSVILNNIKQAIEEVNFIGIKNIRVLMAYITSGKEYQEVVSIAKIYADNLNLNISFTSPLSDMDNYKAFNNYLIGLRNEAHDKVILIGHGSRTNHNNDYNNLKIWLKENYNDFTLVTLEEIRQDTFFKNLEKDVNLKNIVIAPFMILAANHLKNDINNKRFIGKLRSCGFNVNIIERGLCEYKEINKIFVDKL